MSLECRITQTPLLALLVDLGRVRLQNKGICQSGPMDWFAFQLNSLLLENDRNAAQIELMGGTFEALFTANTRIVVTGASAQLSIDGSELDTWQATEVRAGQRVRVSTSSSGAMAYLGVAGGFGCPLTHNSVCAVQREQIGGLHQDGKLLIMGDSIACQSSSPLPASSPRYNAVVKPLINAVYSRSKLTVLPGSCVAQFDPLEWQTFVDTPYQIDAKSNRMGFRLRGETGLNKRINMRSLPLVLGSVQMPPDGNPIVMLADRQTLGGYPQIAIVSRMSIPALVQRGIGASVEFTASDYSSEIFAYRRFQYRLNQLFHS